jgi:hypothetical protein
MGIFLIAAFFVASLSVAILMAIDTFQQYIFSALENLTAYGALTNGTQAHRSRVKIYQTPQAVISAKPKRKAATLSVVTSAQVNNAKASANNLSEIATLPIAA